MRPRRERRASRRARPPPRGGGAAAAGRRRGAARRRAVASRSRPSASRSRGSAAGGGACGATPSRAGAARLPLAAGRLPFLGRCAARDGRRSGAHSGVPARAASEVALEQVGGGARVGVARSPGRAPRVASLGARRAAPPVPRLSARAARQTSRARSACSPSSPAQRQRQPDDHALGPLLLAPAAATAASPRFVSGRSTTASGVASVPVGSEIAAPQRAEPWSSASIAHQRERLLDLGRAPSRAPRAASPGRVPPACASVSRPPPPPPTTWAAALHHVARLHAPLHRRRRDVRHQVHAAVGRRAEHDRRVAELLPHRVRERHAARFGVGVRHRLHDHADAARVLAPRPASASASAFGAPPFGFRSSSFTRALRRSTACTTSCSGTCSSAAISRASRVRSWNRRAASGPGHRLDAAHVRRARGLGRHVEQADLGRRAHVRAAAQLARDALDLDHPHPVAVLLAEQRHRAERARPRRGWSRSRARGGSRRASRSRAAPPRPAPRARAARRG